MDENQALTQALTKEEFQQLNLSFVKDNENEKLILVAFIKDNLLLDKYAYRLEKDHFLTPENQGIFEAVSHLHKSKVPVTIDNLNIYFKQNNNTYLLDAITNVYNVLYNEKSNLDFAINKLFSDHYKHSVYNSLSKVYNHVFDAKLNHEELSNIIKETFKAEYQIETVGLRSIKDIMSTDYLSLEKERLAGKGFYQTGLSTLDKCLVEGFAPTKNTIIGGRSGMGKSMIVINMMDNLSHAKTHSALFSMEMPSTSNLDRFLSKNSGVALERIIKNRNKLTPEELERFVDAKKKLMDNQYIYIDDKVVCNQKYIKNQIMRLQDTLKTEYMVIFIDLLSKVTDLKNVAHGRNLAQQYEVMMDANIEMARELKVHIVGLIQLNRDMEKEGGRKNYWVYRPRGSDLKNANALQEGTDNLFLLYRAKYYDPTLEDDVLEIHIGKQRQGEAPKECYTLCYPSISKITSVEGMVLPYDKRATNI